MVIIAITVIAVIIGIMAITAITDNSVTRDSTVPIFKKFLPFLDVIASQEVPLVWTKIKYNRLYMH